MDDQAVRDKIKSFPRWHYQFDLRGHLTPIHDEQKVNRHAQRKRYFFDPLVELCGGSLAGKRVLDLGCNAGFWSLCAIESGCDFVRGIDGRQMHIDQANFVFEAKEIKPAQYSFSVGNVFQLDYKTLGSFDIVLCLGLMYHINKHVLLLERIAEVNTDILVIDTNLSRANGSYLEIRHETLDDPRNAVDYNLVMSPTKRAMVEMVQQFGYEVAVLKPRFQDYTGAERFQQGERRAFICAKVTDLRRLSAEVETVESRTRKTAGERAATKLSRLVRRLPFGHLLS